MYIHLKKNLNHNQANLTMTTNYVKTNIDYTQNKSCRLRVDRDETVYSVISEFSKLAQK